MILGIDLGTSFSQISMMYLNHPKLLLNPGEYGIPSVFYYDEEVGVLVGQEALDAGQGYDAVNLVRDVKMALLSGKTFTLDTKTFTAKDIVKEIYKVLIQKALMNAQKFNIDTNIEKVIISIPVKFGMQERSLLLEAARDCLGSKKIPVKAIIKEPVAAALSYYQTSLGDNKHVLVYDLGGGTCDIALVRSDPSSSEHYTVVDSDMLRIGGRNWDEELVKYISQMIEKKSGIKIQGDEASEEKVRRAAVAVKHALSEPGKETAYANIIIHDRTQRIVVKRNVFDEITCHLLNQTLDCIQAVYDRNIGSYDIDEIICVGGSSNMPQVKEGLMKRFPDCTIRLYEPELAVVNGAVIFADMPSKLTDITNFSYGIATNTHYGYSDNRYIVENIIKKKENLPAEACQYYNPVINDQKSVLFQVYESEIADNQFDFSVKEKRYVGELTLILPPKATTSLKIACRFNLTADGMLEVNASEPSGKQVKAVFKIESLF